MAKMCNNCGSMNEDSYMNCPNCGAVLEQPTQQSNYNQQYQQQNYNQQYQQQNYNQQYQQPVYNQQAAQAKSKIAAGILGIALGCFGVHNFYLGYTGKAVGQLLITLLSCFFLSPISAIWGLIEGIMILAGSINKDANGMPLSD